MNHCSFTNAIAIPGSIVWNESLNRRDRFRLWPDEKRLIAQSASGWSFFHVLNSLGAFNF
jgi:hypothetical protein